MDTEKIDNAFVFYGTFYDTMIELEQKDKDLAYDFIKAVTQYGLYSEYDESNPIINALMQSVIFGIEGAKDRRKKSQEDGKRGGRKKFPDEVIWKMLDEGKSGDAIAKELGCSVRTVYRAKAARTEEHL